MQVEQVRQLLVDGQILSAEEADRQVADWQGEPDDGAGFVSGLVEQGLTTQFQGQALLDGVAGPYMLGPYRVHDRVAVGRLGNIYRAVHEEFGQAVGLKIFPAMLDRDSEQAIRLAREARVAVQVDHPNVVRTFQVGRVGETVFLAIEDLQGETLAERLKREERLPVVEACRLIREAALGLAHLHDLGIVHRDVQPANVWLTLQEHAKLMEFGAARDALSELDAPDGEEAITIQSADLLGTYDYMSPEQGADTHSADARSDVYSLGCVLFECLRGEVVFPDVNEVRKMLRHAREPARSVSELDADIPQVVADIVDRMLAKEPQDRYQTATDVAWALEQLINLEEEQALVAEDIEPDFLEWARSTAEIGAPDEIPTVLADLDFLDFMTWLTETEQADEQDEQDD